MLSTVMFLHITVLTTGALMKFQTVQKLVTKRKQLQTSGAQDLRKLIFNNTRYSVISKTFILTIFLIALPAFARTGGESGGGGDNLEIRVNDIREDILQWIKKGGAKGLVLPKNLPYQKYESEMAAILEHQKVIVGFIEKDDLYDDELKVSINGVPKTCRGFMSKKDFQPHILCNISRFQNTEASGQYKLIHHEYAGIVNIEKNDGAASDYEISKQITDYLSSETVLKLSIKKKDEENNPLLFSYAIAAEAFLAGSISSTIDSDMAGRWKLIGEAGNPKWIGTAIEIEDNYNLNGIQHEDKIIQMSVSSVTDFNNKKRLFAFANNWIDQQELVNQKKHYELKLPFENNGKVFWSGYDTYQCRLKKNNNRILICMIVIWTYGLEADHPLKDFNTARQGFRAYLKE